MLSLCHCNSILWTLKYLRHHKFNREIIIHIFCANILRIVKFHLNYYLSICEVLDVPFVELRYDYLSYGCSFRSVFLLLCISSNIRKISYFYNLVFADWCQIKHIDLINWFQIFREIKINLTNLRHSVKFNFNWLSFFLHFFVNLLIFLLHFFVIWI